MSSMLTTLLIATTAYNAIQTLIGWQRYWFKNFGAIKCEFVIWKQEETYIKKCWYMVEDVVHM